jgi:hypothetical protein
MGQKRIKYDNIHFRCKFHLDLTVQTSYLPAVLCGVKWSLAFCSQRLGEICTQLEQEKEIIKMPFE